LPMSSVLTHPSPTTVGTPPMSIQKESLLATENEQSRSLPRRTEMANKSIETEVKEYQGMTLKQTFTAMYGAVAALASFAVYAVVIGIRTLKSLAE
jgi:hypothetical protein